MDLYIFCVVLGAAGMAAMAFLGFASSHSAGHHGHDTSGHELHGVGGAHGNSITPGHGHSPSPAHAPAHLATHKIEYVGGKRYDAVHTPVALGHGTLVELHGLAALKYQLLSW